MLQYIVQSRTYTQRHLLAVKSTSLKWSQPFQCLLTRLILPAKEYALIILDVRGVLVFKNCSQFQMGVMGEWAFFSLLSFFVLIQHLTHWCWGGIEIETAHKIQSGYFDFFVWQKFKKYKMLKKFINKMMSVELAGRVPLPQLRGVRDV